MKTTRTSKTPLRSAREMPSESLPTPPTPPTPSAPKPPLSAAQIKRLLWLEGRTLKTWAEENGYAYSTVSAVMSGKIKVLRNYGTGYEIAKKLGLIVEAVDGRIRRARARQ